LIDTNGTVQAHYEYDPYGNLKLAIGDLQSINSFRFSTKYFDGEAGLYYYGYRYHSSQLGRWLSRDPMNEKGGLNIYASCSNNSVNLVDPMGEMSTVVAGAEIGGAVGGPIGAIVGAVAGGVAGYYAGKALNDYINEMRGERNWARKNPNPAKQKTRDPQTGQKIPPKPPQREPPPLPPLVRDCPKE
jgi:RHS repeat-associated protein